MAGLFIRGISAEVHRPDKFFDERDFAGGDAVLRVKVLVGPLPGPLLDWHEGVDLARRVLGWFVQKYQEAS